MARIDTNQSSRPIRGQGCCVGRGVESSVGRAPVPAGHQERGVCRTRGQGEDLLDLQDDPDHAMLPSCPVWARRCPPPSPGCCSSRTRPRARRSSWRSSRRHSRSCNTGQGWTTVGSRPCSRQSLSHSWFSSRIIETLSCLNRKS